MIYKYQKETLAEIKDASKKIERKTNEQYKICIGLADITKIEYGSFRNTEHHFDGKLYLLINHSARFKVVESTICGIESGITFSDIDCFNWVKINKDIFLQLNQLIDQVSKNNFEREQFYNELNKQLKAYNKALEMIE